ncbi:MAG: hypothetical protein ABIJ12_06165, partial [bacterium]
MKTSINIITPCLILVVVLLSAAFAQSTHNRPPKFVEVPDSIMTGSHCDLFTTTVKAKSRILFPDPDYGAIRYKLISGPGEVDARTGVWTYQPTFRDAGDTQTVVIAAVQGKLITVGSDACEFNIIVVNNSPQIGFPLHNCGETFYHPVPGLFSQEFYVFDRDNCERKRVYIEDIYPTPTGEYSLIPNYVNIDFQQEDANKIFHVTLAVRDHFETSRCEFYVSTYFDTLPEPYEIQIEKTHNTFQGGHEYVDVTVNKGTENMLGFDLLIAYDASALSFQTATEGDIYNECDWEYFTYRYGANGNCGENLPSGMIRIVGIAETNNGPYHPACFGSSPYTLCTINFLVTDERIYECQYVPIRFYWCDCDDNSVVYKNQGVYPILDIQGISRSLYDFEGSEEISDVNYGLPGYFGAPTVPCMEGGDASTRFIDFINGGIDIACADSIDARGDLNLNGIANEIADAVLYTNYFVYGLGVFSNYQSQIPASDINADGLTLSVPDLVYLINIIRGDAVPDPNSLGIDTAQIYINNSVLNVTGIDMGAAFIIIEG